MINKNEMLMTIKWALTKLGSKTSTMRKDRGPEAACFRMTKNILTCIELIRGRDLGNKEEQVKAREKIGATSMLRNSSGKTCKITQKRAKSRLNRRPGMNSTSSLTSRRIAMSTGYQEMTLEELITRPLWR